MSRQKRRPFLSRLGNKILLVTLIMVLLVGGILGGMSYSVLLQVQNTSRQAEEEVNSFASAQLQAQVNYTLKTALSSITEARASEVQTHLDQHTNHLLLLADSVTAAFRHSDRNNAVQLPETITTATDLMSGSNEDINDHLFIIDPNIPSDILVRDVAALRSAARLVSLLFKQESFIRCMMIATENGVYYRYSNFTGLAEGFDPRTRSWYTRGIESPQGLICWSQPYYDVNDLRTVTCSMSFRDAEGQNAGVVALDLDIDRLFANIRFMNAQDSAALDDFLLDGNLMFINRDDDIPASLISQRSDGRTMGELLQQIFHTDSYSDPVLTSGENTYFFSMIPATGWIYGLSISNQIIEAYSSLSVDTTKEVIADLNEASSQRIKAAVEEHLLLMLLLMALACFAAWRLSAPISKRIRSLTKGVQEMSAGHLGTHIQISGQDELNELGQAFNHMSDDLQTYVADLAAATAEQEKSRAQLALASQIQISSLPVNYPSSSAYSIFASMDPALDIGGDFYDFFPVDDDRVALVIADVSGKGIPAALMMMTTQTVIRMHLQDGSSPEEAVRSLNNMMCQHDYNAMFVTLWLALIDIRTGHIDAVNAGHEYPAIRRAGGSFELVKDKHSAPAGTMAGLRFRPYELQLEPGDTLFVYTDGVPQATSAGQELFGTQRMLDALNVDPDAEPSQLLARIKEQVDSFVGDAPQFDDMTMLAFRFHGSDTGEWE